MKKYKIKYPHKEGKKCFENKTKKLIHKIDNTHDAKYKKGDILCSCSSVTVDNACKICFPDLSK